MSLPTISFRSLLTQFASSFDRPYDPTQGIDELDVNSKLKLAVQANTAMDRLWRPPNAAFAWKWTTTSGLINLNTDGSIAWSSIQNSDDWFNLWSQDPRPPNNPPTNSGWYVGNPAYAIAATEDITALWPRTSLASIFAFWRIPRPVFNNALVVPATLYNIGQVVYDETATGHCYMALQNAVFGSALSDATKWAVQAPPDRIGNVIADFVETLRVGSKGSDASSKVKQSTMEQWLDVEMSRELALNGSGAPWEFNRWHTSFQFFIR